jgi:hypothetical protein
MEAAEKHQVAGLDDRDRGFNRPAELLLSEGSYQVVFRYEDTRVVTESFVSPADAMHELIRLLHQRGFSQLRSQLSVRGGTYFGNQHPWVEYADPGGAFKFGRGLFRWLRRLVGECAR